MGTESGEHVSSKRYDPGRCPPMHAFFPPRPKSRRTSHATIERVPSSLVVSPSATEASENVPIRS